VKIVVIYTKVLLRYSPEENYKIHCRDCHLLGRHSKQASPNAYKVEHGAKQSRCDVRTLADGAHRLKLKYVYNISKTGLCFLLKEKRREGNIFQLCPLEQD
jgi:hypothetical protein